MYGDGKDKRNPGVGTARVSVSDVHSSKNDEDRVTPTQDQDQATAAKQNGGGFRNANAERRRAENARLADKYITRDGSAPSLDDLGGMSPAEYGVVRADLAGDLGIPKALLDDEYKERHKRPVGRSGERPHWSVEPAEHPVKGGDLIKKVSRRIKRHVVMDDEQVLTVAIWVAFAWTHDAATHTPILCVTSPEAECGKTTLLGLLQLLTPKGMLFVDTSSAVLYRMIEAWHPTLIVDEADVMFKDNAELRSIINAGWTRGAGVPRCNQETNEPEFFETFGPKVIGLKGLRLPDTTLSRSIIIAMERKLPRDRVADFDHLDDADLATLRSELARFAHDNIEQLRAARPKPPEGFYNRLAANWRLMLAIADLCGLGTEARAAAIKLSRRADEASFGVELLRDIRDIFERLRSDRIPSQQLVNELATCSTGLGRKCLAPASRSLSFSSLTCSEAMA